MFGRLNSIKHVNVLKRNVFHPHHYEFRCTNLQSNQSFNYSSYCDSFSFSNVSRLRTLNVIQMNYIHEKHLIKHQKRNIFTIEDPEKQINLGIKYLKGDGVEQNFEEGARLLKLASEQGHPLAQTNLGKCYSDGIGVEQNLEESIRLYQLAAEQGYAIAQYNLSSCYFNGYGVEKNIEKGMMYLKLAAKQGHIQATTKLFRWIWN